MAFIGFVLFLLFVCGIVIYFFFEFPVRSQSIAYARQGFHHIPMTPALTHDYLMAGNNPNNCCFLLKPYTQRLVIFTFKSLVCSG